MVIDVGCGVGFTTKKVASKAKSLLAIDLSNKCIEIAQSNCKKYKNVDFKNISIEKYAKDTTSPRFTLAIANMTLMTSLNLDSFIKSIHKILVPGGKFVATITHPCFWPIYRGYSTADWFDYTKEIIIEAPFWITNEHTKYKTTHVHRPLEMYYSAFKKNLFIVESFCEPMPDNEILKKYSQIWLSPHFAAFRCISK
jgi:2-polyprenyl-3-methyl-5-hydroxy-6-metoxy-1,4-benzoquinol methylase